MLSHLSHKRRFYLILIGSLLLLWISFKFGFNKTWELKEQIKVRTEQLNGIQDVSAKLQMINDKLSRLETMGGDVSGEETNPYLIEKASRYCHDNGLILYEVPRKHLYVKDHFAVITYQVVIQGSFKKLLVLLNDLEHKSVAGKLRAVDFKCEFNPKESKYELFGTYYIQTIGKLKE